MSLSVKFFLSTFITLWLLFSYILSFSKKGSDNFPHTIDYLVSVPGISFSESPYAERFKSYEDQNPFFSFPLYTEAYSGFIYAR